MDKCQQNKLCYPLDSDLNLVVSIIDPSNNSGQICFTAF